MEAVEFRPLKPIGLWQKFKAFLFPKKAHQRILMPTEAGLSKLKNQDKESITRLVIEESHYPW